MLDVVNVSQAVDGLDDDEKQQVGDGISIGYTGPAASAPWVISESGLYSLILRSRKPEAKAFKRWVTTSPRSDVLTEVRPDEKCRLAILRGRPKYRSGFLTLPSSDQRGRGPTWKRAVRRRPVGFSRVSWGY
jgi:hypothetical protein